MIKTKHKGFSPFDELSGVFWFILEPTDAPDDRIIDLLNISEFDLGEGRPYAGPIEIRRTVTRILVTQRVGVNGAGIPRAAIEGLNQNKE